MGEQPLMARSSAVGDDSAQFEVRSVDVACIVRRDEWWQKRCLDVGSVDIEGMTTGGAEVDVQIVRDHAALQASHLRHHI